VSMTPQQIAAGVLPGGFDGTPASPVPADFGLVGWSQDPATAATAFSPAAGVLHLARVPIRGTPQPVVSSLFHVTQAGSGGQLPVNVFTGIYDQAGNRIGPGSVAQDTPVQSIGVKKVSLVLGGAYILGPFVWVAFVIGTQSTTPVQLAACSAAGLGLWNAVAANCRYGTTGAGLTALPASFTPSGITPAQSFVGGIANA